MKSKQIELKDFINTNRRKVQLENLSAKQGFTFEDDKLLAIRKKIEAAGVPLGEIEGVSISNGIFTGCNRVFIVDKDVISKINQELIGEVIFKTLNGKDVEKYRVKYADRYMIMIPKGYTNKYGGNKIKDLIKLLEEMDRLGSKSCKHRSKDYVGDYWYENYNTEKVLGKFKHSVRWQEINESSTFVYVDEMILGNDKLPMINGEDIIYMVGILNSKIINSISKKAYVMDGLGKSNYWKVTCIKRIPIVTPKESTKLRLEKLVEKIQQLKKEDKPTDHLEAEVEKIVQELYGLTDEEVEYLCK